MIVAVLTLSFIALAAFMRVVIGIQLTEHHKSLADPTRDGPAAAFARRVLRARACQVPNYGRPERASHRERVRT